MAFETLRDCVSVGGFPTADQLTKLQGEDKEAYEEIIRLQNIVQKAEAEIDQEAKDLAGINWGLGLAFAYFDED